MEENKDMLESTLEEIRKEQKYLSSSTEPSWKLAMKLAELCVKYRIKQPPIRVDAGYNKRNMVKYLCPTCQKAINSGLRPGGDHILDYCNVCGQAIDWGDKHE